MQFNPQAGIVKAAFAAAPADFQMYEVAYSGWDIGDGDRISGTRRGCGLGACDSADAYAMVMHRANPVMFTHAMVRLTHRTLPVHMPMPTSFL